MKRSWLLLGFFGPVAFFGQTSWATDKQELVLTRQEIRRQIYLYNGWMADVLSSTETPNTTTQDLLPPDDVLAALLGQLEERRPLPRDLLPLNRVVPALLGQLEERTLLPEDIAAQRERLTRWIGFLATARRFNGGAPSPEAPTSKLPVASVALHFRRSKPGSSLPRDFRDESDAYSRLRLLTEPLRSEFLVMHKAFREANPNLDYQERISRFESSKEVTAWLSKVQGNLEAIDRECATIGYPVTVARAIRESVVRIRQGIKPIEGKVAVNPFASPPVTLVATSLEKLSVTSRKAGNLCQTLSEAYVEPPDGIDAVAQDLAWSSIVPLLSDPDPEQLATRLKQAIGWIDAVGLKKDLSFDSLEIIGPTELQLHFSETISFWKARPLVAPSTGYIVPVNRLFYKFTGAIGATPAAVSMTITGNSSYGSYSWHKGLISGSIQHSYFFTASATVGGEFKKDDLAKILPMNALATSETDAVSTSLSRRVRTFLVKYLKTFKGRVAVIHDEPSYLLLRVSNAKNLILATGNLWEDVDINFIIATSSAQGAKLLCIVDGRWAPGILAPNSAEAFRDMEPQYSKNLGDFAGQLLVRMKDDLLKQNGDAKPR